MASGNSQILNSRISGGRAALNVSGGNVVVDNSRIELGAVASVLVGAANSLTLRNVTLVQKPTASTYDSSKTLMGFSVLYLCDSEGKAAPTTIEGSFVQQAWVNADDKQYVPSAGQDIVDGVMKETAFIHNINGKDSLNLGFAYMPEDTQKTVAAPDNITDNRTDKATIPYEMKDVKIQIAILSTTLYFYSYKNTNGTADSFKNVSDYVPSKHSDIITVSYSDTADGLTTGKSYGTDGWVYELNVDLDKLRPQVAVPYSPTKSDDATNYAGQPIDQVVIGSCTNGTAEDIRTAYKYLKGNYVSGKTRLIVIPGSQKVLCELADDGTLLGLVRSGAVIAPASCGACMGGHTGILGRDEVGLYTTNRNFYGRNGVASARVYLCSPAIAAYSAVKGCISVPEY